MMKTHWEEEKQRLLGEKAVLQEAANRLNVQVQDAKVEVKKGVEIQNFGQKMRAEMQSVSSSL